MASAFFDSHDWYDAPAYYDIGFASGTNQEAEFLRGILQNFGPPNSRRILEPACGSGRLVEAMTQMGYQVAGFDRNAQMVAYSKTRLRHMRPKADIKAYDMAHFDYNRPFHLAHCLVSTFKYLLNEASAVAHLQCVSRALVQDGIYVLGFHLSNYQQTTRTRETWFGSDGPIHVVCNIQTWPADKQRRREQMRSRLSVRHGRKRQNLETNWLFRTYDAGQVRRLLAKVPDLQLVATYDFSYDLSAPRALDNSQLDCVLILRRRA